MELQTYSMSGNDEYLIHRTDSGSGNSVYSTGDASAVVDSLVDANKTCSSWVINSCGFCTEYMDKQVQYEMMAQRFQDTARSFKPTGTFDIQKAVASCQSNFDDIKATAAMMFDEESVVESVDHR